jgi:hypothetical protein
VVVFSVIAGKFFTTTDYAFCIEANPTIADAHKGVWLAGMIQVPKGVITLRSVDRKGFIKLNNGDAFAAARSTFSFN